MVEPLVRLCRDIHAFHRICDMIFKKHRKCENARNGCRYQLFRAFFDVFVIPQKGGPLLRRGVYCMSRRWKHGFDENQRADGYGAHLLWRKRAARIDVRLLRFAVDGGGGLRGAVAGLLGLFYQFKADIQDALSDDELIDAMAAIFNGPAQGAIEALADVGGRTLYRFALRKEAQR